MRTGSASKEVNYAMSTQFHWTTKRHKAALALAEGQTQEAVAAATGVCRKTICNWLCVPEFAAEVDRLSSMVSIASRAERLRIAMRAVRQRVREDGTIETDRDVLDWLKFAQSETDGIELSLPDVALMDEAIERQINQIVETRIRERQLKLKESNSVDPPMPENLNVIRL